MAFTLFQTHSDLQAVAFTASCTLLPIHQLGHNRAGQGLMLIEGCSQSISSMMRACLQHPPCAGKPKTGPIRENPVMATCRPSLSLPEGDS